MVRPRRQNAPVESLDQIDPKRHDTQAILDKANQFAELPESQQAQYLGPDHFAGLDEAEHSFSGLLIESHNPTAVVRDIDGTLRLLYQPDPRSEHWELGPLYRDNLISDGQVEELAQAGWPEWDWGGATTAEVRAALHELPTAPGSVCR